jgi:cyclohexanecarboxylate-CoA ligase
MLARLRNLRPPVPDALIADWRAAGIWTDETLLDRLAAAPERFGADTVAVHDDDTSLTMAELVTTADRIAAALHVLGVERGDIVAFQLPNWWEAIAIAWGIVRAGAIASPITATLRAREVGFILEHTEARAIFAPRAFRNHDYAAMLASVVPDIPAILVRDAGFDDFLAAGSTHTPPVLDPPITVDDPAVVLWTSGTTSDPKGVIHTHQSLRVETDGLAVAHAFTPADRQLVPMPITHIAGLTYGMLCPPLLGVPATLMATWEPGAALDLVASDEITVMISTPVFVRTMLDHPRFDDASTVSVRLLSLGGAGVAPATVREGATRVGPAGVGTWCKRTYGSTEYPTLTTALPNGDPAANAATDGALIGAAELRIVDSVLGTDMPRGIPGEVWARGPEMFWGYLDASLDVDAFAPDGWFRTGDLGVFDGTHLTIIDRLKDIIIRGGENISALEVERALLSHPAVADAAVVARPDETMGERACAFVIPADPASPPTLPDLVAYLREQDLATFKFPEYLQLRTTLPRTASGKVQKTLLRAELRTHQ